jgi:hypothetical protein
MRYAAGRTVVAWIVVAVLCLVAFSALLSARKIETPQETDATFEPTQRSAKVETTWIFDANFEDFEGDNWGIQDLGQPGDSLTGWHTYDASGNREQGVYWHVDTVNAYPDGTPPDSSMWCGTTNKCWLIPRGYGNRWRQYLERGFDLTPYAGSEINLDFRQKFALERLYDLGYVDVSTDSGETWTTVAQYSDPGFEAPFWPVDWDYPGLGHVSLDLTEYAGVHILVRWRVESDYSVSCEDVDPASNPEWLAEAVEDGAWYIDEVRVLVSDTLEVFHANFEDASNACNRGWIASTIAPGGATGIVWRRAFDLDTSSKAKSANWMLVATDPATDSLVDSERANLVSPYITIAGEDSVVVEVQGWNSWVSGWGDWAKVWAATRDSFGCEVSEGLQQLRLGTYGSPVGWFTERFVAQNPSGRKYLKLKFQCVADASAPHTRGLYLDRVRVGVPHGGPTHAGAVLGIESPSEPLLSFAPNPFSGHGTLTFRIEEPGAVKIDVFDISGRLVASLLKETLNPGSYAVEWDGRDSVGHGLSPGVYFVRLRTAAQTTESKLILLH